MWDLKVRYQCLFITIEYRYYMKLLFTLKLSGLICFDFVVLPMKVNEKSTVVRHLFLKMNATREKCPQKPEYQTLFVIGVPTFCDQVMY